MKNIFVATLTAILALGNITAFSQNTIIGSKTSTTRKVDNIGSFKNLTVNGSPDVVYKQVEGGSPRIEIFGPDNIVPLVETFVENNTLIVRFKKNTNIQNRGKLEVRVWAPALDNIKVQGSGDIYLPEGINTSRLRLAVAGSGDISGKKIACSELEISVAGSGDIHLREIKATNLNAKVSGSGDIHLEGTATHTDYAVRGSGDIKADKLKAEHVQAQVNGSGDITCYATQTLKGKVNGSGDVGYKGNPEISFSKKGLRKL